MSKEPDRAASVEVTGQALQEARQGAILVAGTLFLGACTLLLVWRANVPRVALWGCLVAVVLVVALVFFFSPAAIRRSGDILISLLQALSSKQLGGKLRRWWHKWLDSRASFRWITKRSEDEGTLWLPFIFQLAGLAWVVHFSGGLSASPFGGVLGVVFAIAISIIKLPSESDRSVAENTAKRNPFTRLLTWVITFVAKRHPFTRLLAVAAAFAAVLAFLDHAWPYEPSEPINSDATLWMTLGTLAVGILLAMLARLGAEAERESSHELSVPEVPNQP